MAEISPARTVMITGATGALGSALAQILAGEGVELVLIARRGRALERLQDELTRRHQREAVICEVDLAELDPAACDALVEQLLAEFGRLDALVHCAAEFTSLRPLDQVPPAEWLSAMQVNLNAPWLLSAACLPLLRRAPAGGRLAFVLDDIDRAAQAYWGPYAIGKGALRTLSRLLAQESEGTGLTVIGFEPGAMRSNLRSRAYLAESPEAQPDPAIAAEALARLLSPDNPIGSGIYRRDQADSARE